MRHLTATCLAFALALPFPLQAATPEEVDALIDALHADEMVEILREEGVMEAAEIADEMFPGRTPSSWDNLIDGIYDQTRVMTMFRDRMADGLTDTDITPLLDFFQSDRGQQITTLELSGRRAFISEDVEAAAREAWEDAERDDTPRVAQIREFIETNDLLDLNVAGALNASLAFYGGLATGEPFEMTEDQILSDVWSQEAAIRADTEGWLTAYLSMSYEPLADEDLAAYIDLSQSEAGQDLNQAMFAAFDVVFDDISFRLGETIAILSAGEEL